MKTTIIVKKRRKQRILFILVSSIIISLMSLLAFFALFLIIPGLMIKTGIIAPAPLIILWLLSLVVPLSILLYKFPFWGDKFFHSIISKPFSSKDLKSALELDKRKGYPNDLIKRTNSLSAFLAEGFSTRVSGSIIDEKSILNFIFPKKSRIVFLCIIFIVAAILSIVRISFLADIATALRTGLPTELISVGPVLKFDKIEARIIPPAYLDSDEVRITDLKSKDNIKALEGSKVIITGNLKGLVKGELFFSTQKGLEYFPVNIKNREHFEVSFLAPMKGAFALEFVREYKNRHSVGKSRAYRIEAFPDMPPEIRIHAPGKFHTIVYGYSFGISFTATDDYGILEISLCHREAGSGSEYNRELITRFPRESRKAHATTYMWNPILREGEKLQELVYHPGTEKVEYYIEVKDINIFSSGGITESETMFVSFTSLISEMKSALYLIKELIDKGNDLLNDIDNSTKIGNYLNKLDLAIKTFSKELNDTLPRSNLIYESRKIHSILSKRIRKDEKESLKSYIEFLERYLALLNVLMEAERHDMTSGEITRAESEFNSGNHESSFKRLASIAESLGKEIMDELGEIQKLMDEGNVEQAKEKMAKLLEKIRQKLLEEMQKAKSMVAKMAKEAMEKLNKITANAKERIKEEKKNISRTKKKRIKACTSAQSKINEKLDGLAGLTQELTSEYPIVMGGINSYARAAKIHGERSLANLEKRKIPEAVKSEEKVVSYLETLIKDSSQQMKRLQEMAKGNLESMMPRGQQNRFVYIPKEAVYTVPVKYKDKIIDMSKKRGKTTSEKEAFWRDVLE